MGVSRPPVGRTEDAKGPWEQGLAAASCPSDRPVDPLLSKILHISGEAPYDAKGYAAAPKGHKAVDQKSFSMGAASSSKLLPAMVQASMASAINSAVNASGQSPRMGAAS